MRLQRLEHRIALVRGLAHREAADGIAVEADLAQRLDGLEPQRQVRPALHDAEERVRVAEVAERVAAPARPAHRELHGLPRLRLARRVRRALVEDHDHVGVERGLHLHGDLRTQEHRISVHRRPEADTVLRELAQLRQAEHLEAAGVGEDRARPVHEAVQAAVRADHLGPGTQHQVKGVAEHDRAPSPVSSSGVMALTVP